MDVKRELWGEAYKFYQAWVKKMEGAEEDMAGYFCALTKEIMERCKVDDGEAGEMWKGIYAMLSERAKAQSDGKCSGQ